MSKIDLDPITSGYNLSKINANFQKVEDELNNKVLYRNSPAGEPNSMSSNLDMNSQSILNASKVSSNVLELGGVQVVPTGLAIDPYNGTREALRRSYAEAGCNLVDGSFEAGGTLVNANDVMLQERTGKAFTGPAGTVAAGTNPASGGFVDRSNASLYEFNAATYGLKEGNTGLENCKALQALSSAVKAANGGNIIFPGGTYRVGHQTLAGSFGVGASWIYSPMFELSGCTGRVRLEFLGCKFELEDNLRFGAFHPVTGMPENTTLPFYNKDYAAHTGRVIMITECEDVELVGTMSVDGRDTARIIGGGFGDKGTQCIEYGIQLYNNKRQKLAGLFHLHHLCLDGFYFAGRNGPDCRSSADGVISLYNGRQGLSLCGGSNVSINNSTFGLTGYGVINSAPCAAVDIEPEINPIDGAVFNNCTLLRTKNGTLIADDFPTRGVVFNECVIENELGPAIYTKVSNMKFNNCTIRGIVQPCQSGTNNYQTHTGIDNIDAYPEFHGCSFYNTLEGGTRPSGFPTALDSVRAKLFDCKVYVEVADGDSHVLWLDNSYIKNMRVVVSGDLNEAVYSLAYLRNMKEVDGFYVANKTTSKTGAHPSAAALINARGADSGPLNNMYIEPSIDGFDTILWDNNFWVAGGRSGFRMDTGAAKLESKNSRRGSSAIGLAKQRFESLDYYKVQTITSNNSVPTSGNYERGDVVMNSEPSASGAFGWMCTTTGTAGSTAVFKVITNIGA